MRKFYAIAAFTLLGAAAMQAQPAHYIGVARGNEFKAEMIEAENAGNAVVATVAERAEVALKAAPAAGEAYYYRPAGAFFVGTAGTTTYSQYTPYLIVSPYKTYTFKAQEADSYSWRFQIGNTWYENLTSRNINAKYNFETDSVPSLTVGETEYHVFGNQSADQPKNRYSMLYAVPRHIDYIGTASSGPYYASPKYFALRDRDNTGNGTRYFTGSTNGYAGGTGYWFGFNTSGWNGMATYVEAPQNPYMLMGGAVRYSNLAFVDATADNNVPIYIDVYAVTTHTDQTLELGEKLATATAYLTNESPASGGFLYEFEQPLEVTQAIAVVARGYDNEALKGFTMSVARDGWNEGHGQHGYMLKVGEEGVPTQIVGLGNFFSNTDLGITAPSILLDVKFPFMRYYYTNVTDPQMEFTVEGECTSEGLGNYAGNQLPIWASDPSTNWTLTSSNPSDEPEVKAADGGPVPDWINYQIEDVMSEDEYTHRSVMTVTVGENDGVARSALITITQPASEAITLKVSQAAASSTPIDVVDAAKNVESVSYFNLAGVESSTPFKGVNIEVKRYSDGSKTTSKLVR